MNLKNNIKRIKYALYKPKLPIPLAIWVSFAYKGVYSSSTSANFFSISPLVLLSPMTTHTILPSPVNRLVPLNKTGLGISCLPILCPYFFKSFLLSMHLCIESLFIGSDSPVIADSSAEISTPSIKIPSAGISIPPLIFTMSPAIHS